MIIRFVIWLALINLFIACSTYQSITKRREPQLEDVDLKIKPDNRYLFYLNSGTKLEVIVTKVDSLKVYGKAIVEDEKGKRIEYPYEETKQKIADNTTRIGRYKFNPFWTVIAVAIPTAIIVWSISTFSMDSPIGI